MINEVTKEECLDAIDFLHTQGFIDQIRNDEKYCVEILLKKVANDYNIKLESREELRDIPSNICSALFYGLQNQYAWSNRSTILMYENVLNKFEKYMENHRNHSVLKGSDYTINKEIVKGFYDGLLKTLKPYTANKYIRALGTLYNIYCRYFSEEISLVKNPFSGNFNKKEMSHG